MTRVRNVFAEARARLEAGEFTLSDFDALETAVLGQTLRQRLLYLYAQQPTVRASIVAATLQEPAGYGPGIGQIDPLAPEIPYASVMDAVSDGWRVVHFPDHRGPYQEGRIDMLGYEFVLEKFE